MEPIVVIAFILASTVLLKIAFSIDTKEVEPLKENKDLEILTNKLPENTQIAKEMLEILGNQTVKVEVSKNSKTSLYIAITNKISIADIKNNYARIQTIAHECLHSVQDRRLLLFNFIFSNIIILYWLTISILTAIHVITNIAIPVFVLLLMATIKLAIRGFLETDAIMKSKYLSKEYMESKNILTEKEIISIIEKYDEINKIAVPFTILRILSASLISIFIYATIALIFQ